MKRDELTAELVALLAPDQGQTPSRAFALALSLQACLTGEAAQIGRLKAEIKASKTFAITAELRRLYAVNDPAVQIKDPHEPCPWPKAAQRGLAKARRCYNAAIKDALKEYERQKADHVPDASSMIDAPASDELLEAAEDALMRILKVWPTLLQTSPIRRLNNAIAKQKGPQS